jgi:sec-independent protein translocase protein TatA
MFGLGAGELFLILVLALVFIGPKKLPELAKGLGKGIREFNKAKNELVNTMNADDGAEQTKVSEQNSMTGVDLSKDNNDSNESEKSEGTTPESKETV